MLRHQADWTYCDRLNLISFLSCLCLLSFALYVCYKKTRLLVSYGNPCSNEGWYPLQILVRRPCQKERSGFDSFRNRVSRLGQPVGHRFKSKSTNLPRFKEPGLPWWSSIRVLGLTEVDVRALTSVNVPISQWSPPQCEPKLSRPYISTSTRAFNGRLRA